MFRGSELAAEVDRSYDFLNDMPDDVTGTLPRMQFEMGSWNESRPISSKERSRINYWEPRLKSVRDIESVRSHRSRQRDDHRMVPDQFSSVTRNHGPRSPDVYQYDSSSVQSLARKFGKQNPEELKSLQNSRNYHQQERVSNGHHYAQPNIKYASQPSLNVLSDHNSARQRREVFASSRNTIHSSSGQQHHLSSRGRTSSYSDEEEGSSLLNRTNEAYKTKEVPLRPKVESNGKVRGSFLLQRTTQYLEASEKLRQAKDNPMLIPEDEIDYNYDDEETQYHRVRVSPNEKSKKRTSILDRVEDIHKAANPPPPPPPPPPGSMMNVTPPTPVASSATKPKKPQQDQLPYLSDVKEGRKGLKPTSHLTREGLRRTTTPEPEPITFKEKLNRILQHQVAERRWPQVGNHGHAQAPNLVKPAAPAQNHETIKTLNKNAMKSKLEDILVKGPSNRPSMRGAFDMDEKRQEAINKLRAKQAEQNAKDVEDDSEEGATNISIVQQDKVASKQKALMANVMSTIRLKGQTEESQSTI